MRVIPSIRYIRWRLIAGSHCAAIPTFFVALPSNHMTPLDVMCGGRRVENTGVTATLYDNADFSLPTAIAVGSAYRIPAAAAAAAVIATGSATEAVPPRPLLW